MNSMNKLLPASRPSRPLRFISAFTLVELMVVLAIIAALMLLMVPNVRRHQARARSTQCQNNLRQYGIAMAQYLTDWNGYFIFPGGAGAGGIGRVKTSADFDASGYHDKSSYGARAGSGEGHSWGDFVALYVPAPEITGEFLRSGQNCVRICPEVTREVFLPGDPKHKGYSTVTNALLGELTLTDFEIDVSSSTNLYQSSSEVYFEDYFTTYGINKMRSGEKGQAGTFVAYQRLSSNIPSRVVAFIDWNAEEGWGANIVPTENVWQFDGSNRLGIAVKQGDPKDGDWWHTEIGFYHPGKSNDLVANYVAMDGSVHSVSSNEISTNFFR